MSIILFLVGTGIVIGVGATCWHFWLLKSQHKQEEQPDEHEDHHV